ncbi:hypothetical protein PAMA_011891 [Pampus argenteus]
MPPLFLIYSDITINMNQHTETCCVSVYTHVSFILSLTSLHLCLSPFTPFVSLSLSHTFITTLCFSIFCLFLSVSLSLYLTVFLSLSHCPPPLFLIKSLSHSSSSVFLFLCPSLLFSSHFIEVHLYII